MSKAKSKDFSRRRFLEVSVGAVVAAGVGCSSEDKTTPGATGGAGGGSSGGPTGGATGASTGGGPAAGGAVTGSGGAAQASGGTVTASGGVSAGGTVATGGVRTGGTTATTGGGGAATTGGTSATGGSGGGGRGSGGTSTAGSGGGGGRASGGTSPGGASAGGTSPGGASAGGTSAGGSTATGGTATSGGTSSGGVGQGGSVTGGTSPTGGTTGTGGSATGGTSGGDAGTTPLVALVRNTDVIAATMAAINAVGGLPNLAGKAVMLRPNMIDSAPPGSVNPDVIRGVIRACVAAGATASSITVAEDAFTGNLTNANGTGIAQRNGIAAAVSAEGATLLDMKGTTTVNVTPTGATNWTGAIPMYPAVMNADYIINIPVCKTHGSANFSMAIKGWYGCESNRSHNHSPTVLGPVLAEIHLAKREDFVVLDATKCLLNGGPQVGSSPTASPGIVAASKDAIAIDVTGLCIIKHYLQQTGTTNTTRITNQTVWAQPQIARAMALTSLGWLTSAQDFPYSADGISEAETIMAYRTG